MGKKKKKRAQLPFRLNIIFFIVFLLFSVLILQLGVVQILNGEDFQEEIDRTIRIRRVFQSQGERFMTATWTSSSIMNLSIRLRIHRQRV